MVHVAYFTDPLCPWSWAAEPALRRLQVEFSDSLAITYLMVGIAQEVDPPAKLATTLETGDLEVLRAAALEAGATPGPLPDVEEALRAWAPLGAAEVAAICGIPRTRAQVELWRLAGELRARPRDLVCGELWELA